MKTTNLSHAIKLVLAAQVGASVLTAAPLASAQQVPAQSMALPQPAAVYPQGAYVGQQQLPAYRQPQPQVYYAHQQAAQPVAGYPQPAYVAQPQPQVVYQQPPAQQYVYAQPQSAAPQPGQPAVYAQPYAPSGYAQPGVQPQPYQQMVYPQATYPQGAVVYAQPMPAYPQGMQQYGNAVMQAPGVMPGYQVPGYQMPGYQGGVTQVAPSQAAAGQAVYPQGMVVYQNGVPVQMPAGAVYGYSGQAPQGAVVYPNGAAAQAVAYGGQVPSAQISSVQMPGSNVPSSVLPDTVGVTSDVFSGGPRLQTGSLSKLASSGSNRPIQTVTYNDLRNVNAVNVESALNTLPQVIPGLDRTSNNPGNGRATVDLRGLGSNRTAVLVNGMPFAPATGGGVADLNAIPQALIKQVDVATGGSSVAYGSGAVAGAVNFVLDDDFQGAELSLAHQSSAQGDAGLSSVDLTLGSKLAGGRGNVAFSIGGSDREAVSQGDREFSFFRQSDSTDSAGNPILIPGGSSGVPGTSIFSGALGGFSPDTFGVTFDPDGSVRPFQSGEENDFYNYAPVNYLQIPQTRRHATAIANFDLTDNMEVYGVGMYSENDVARQLAPTPIFQTSSFTVDGSPFLPLSSQQVLSDAFGDGIDTDGDGIDDTATAFLRRRLLESGPRRTSWNSKSAYVQAGLRGDISDSLEYDLYASRSSVSSVIQEEGNVSRSRFDQALLLDLQADPEGGVCQQVSSDSTNVSCAPLNIFGEGNISAEGAEFIAGNVTQLAETTQSIYGARLTGKLGAIGGGEARFTVGAERRENAHDYQYLPDDSGPGGFAGFNGATSFSGSTSSESVYGDIYLPLIANATGAELVDLELGYRLTDYPTSGGVASYSANTSWAPTEAFRVRAGYNRAHRAPAISELFVAQSEGFPGASDPCSASGSPPGGLTPEQVALCVATGVPEQLVGSPSINPASGQVRALSGGNPELQEEQFETMSLGFELAIPVGEEGRFHAGGDYFAIDGSGVVAAFGGGAANVLNNCYAANQSADGSNSLFCDVINRGDDGRIESVELFSQNVAQFDVEGVDLFAGVSLPAMGGTVGFDFNATVLNTHRFTAFEGDDAIECAGKFGNLCGEPMAGYSHRVTAGWSNENLGASLIWRHIGEVEDDDANSTFAREKLGARNYLDAEVNVSLANSLGLSLGVQNLTDVAPPIAGDNQEQANTYPATYDAFGRTYFVRLTGASSLSGE